MSRPTFHIITSGNWSGGGMGVISNYRHAATRHPELSVDGGEIALVNRNYPNDGWHRPFILAPQNAWPWHGPRLGVKEHLKVALLRVASEAAIRRAVGVIRVGISIPHRQGMHSQILPNPLDPAFEDHSRGIADTPRPADSPYILSLGSINSYRGIEHLLDGYRIYRERGGTLALRVVGGGKQHYLDRIRQLSNDLPDVTISTRGVDRRQALILLHHASAAVLPSHVEASPFSLLEALAVQHNVIASDIPGHHDIVPPGVPTPAWFHHGDPVSLAGHLLAARRLPGLPNTPLADSAWREDLRCDWGDRLVAILRDLVGVQS